MSRKVTEEEKEKYRENKVIHKKLSKMVLQGVAYTESAEVKSIDEQVYDVLIRPLGEGEIIEAYRDAGVRFSDFQDEAEAAKKMEETMLVQHNLISKAAKGEKGETWTPKEVGALIRFGESFALARHILELSGIIGREAEAVKTFRAEPVQHDN